MSASRDRSQKIGFATTSFLKVMNNARVLKAGHVFEPVKCYTFSPLPESQVKLDEAKPTVNSPSANSSQVASNSILDLLKSLKKLEEQEAKLKSLLEELDALFPKKK